ncbi:MULTISPECIES: M81 family metallopeptidase [unclassified Chelatococcus]|uniref:M81 family metallopeptidase n=1 Tax=unclassified Chelatococcus TaxID=2638111 RepID=UPI001BCBC4F5|nr:MULTISPECIES: M81 family metallopeptidase [unclassified Chelatococcus]MBS7700925.1 M81 family metallopeptidase [Chelatococcus sp. YT9]MBX3555458.1 M81 family metallopeptidase [Chelatococcus sp.]
MRVFAASLATETNTFAPLFVDRSAFEGAFYCPPGTHPDTPTLCSGPMIAARELAQREGLTLIEGTATWAEPAGLVSREAYESLRDEIIGQLKAALPVDIVLFGLHGAMVAHGYDDCEGDLLAHARAIAGPRCIIGAELDMHCHLTDQMVEAADVINAFKEFPHTDFLERGRDLARLCLRAARGEVRPVTAVFDCRAIAGFMTSQEPGRGFVDRMLAMEGHGDILSISVAHGFQAGDVYDVGTKVLVIADGDVAKASVLAEQLGREILSWGPGGGVPPHYKPEEGIAEAVRLAQPGRPVVLADRWDNPGGGVAGDSSVMVDALLKHPDIPAAIGAMWDPVAVGFCRAAGVGAEFRLRFCGKAAPTSGHPIDADVRVRGVTDDLLIPFEQSWVSLGPAAAISIGSLDVVLSSTRAQTFSPPVFTNLGIDLGAKTLVVVKSSNHFYAAFAPIAATVLYLDTGGPYPSDTRMIPYKKARRPLAPLDPNPLL